MFRRDCSTTHSRLLYPIWPIFSSTRVSLFTNVQIFFFKSREERWPVTWETAEWNTLETGVCVCLVTQSFLTLCDPTDCSPPGSSVHGDSPGKNIETGCLFLLQGIFQIQGLNPGLRTAGRFFAIWATSPSKNKLFQRTSQVVLVVKNSPANAGDTGLIPGPGRSHW